MLKQPRRLPPHTPPAEALAHRVRTSRCPRSPIRTLALALACMTLPSIAGCAAEPVTRPLAAPAPSPRPSAPPAPGLAAAIPAPSPAAPATAPSAPRFPPAASRAAVTDPQVRVSKPAQLNATPLAGTTLRFENADIYEVIQVILGDILHLNYLVDPAIQGKITLNTQQPVSTADVFGILESVMRLHNISIVREGALYKVLRDAGATRDAIGFVAAGENSPLIRVVPLAFVQASALVNVLRNFVGPQGAITNDATNRYLILADRASNVTKLLGMIASLDVDYLQHIRIRIVQIEKGDATELAREMGMLFHSSGLFNWPGTEGAKVFFMPVVRMNAILVAAANGALLAAAEKWIRTLDDEPKDGVGATIHVYSIANSNALHIADILRQIYGGAPIPSARAGDPTRVVVRGNVPPASAGTTAGTGLSGSVQIIPDEATNSLVIKASPQDFLQIKKVIQRIDTTPRQVMIQVMVAEVTLTDNLQYGVEWWLKNRTAPLGLDTGLVAPAVNPVISVPAGGASGGLNLLLLNSAGDITGLFNLLASNTDVNILSAPHVLASDGKTAKIEVGSEEPVITQTVSAPTNTLGGTLSTSNSVQYRPTGILLEVKPSINASGRVTLSVIQEVSARGSSVEAGGSVYPSFTKRRVSTEVTLEEGRTLMIAGLIQDRGNTSSQGLPSLKDIPLLGVLFGTRKRESDKTELMMTITPYIVRDRDEGERLTRSFQESVTRLKGLIQKNPPPALLDPSTEPPAGPGQATNE